MEILNSHSAPCSRLVTSSQHFSEKGLGSKPTKFSGRRKHKFYSGLIKSKVWSLQNTFPSGFHLNGCNSMPKCMVIRAIKGVEGVIDAEENVTKRRETIPKVLIPGLPDDSKGDINVPVSSGQWEWKPKFNIHFERSGSRKVDSPQVLFLPGFGVGSFHFEKQLKDLGRDYGVWAMDFLGQGMSLPCEDPTQKHNDSESQIDDLFWGFGDETEPWADDLVYSIDLWQEQVRYFIEEVCH